MSLSYEYMTSCHFFLLVVRFCWGRHWFHTFLSFEGMTKNVPTPRLWVLQETGHQEQHLQHAITPCELMTLDTENLLR